MFLKSMYNRWYYAMFSSEQKQRVRLYREKHKKPPKPKKEVIKPTIQRGHFIITFD